MNSSPISWKIGAEPATLTGEEFRARYDHPEMPEKFEVYQGKLFWADEQRLHVLAMLIEEVGLRHALALCSPEAVKQALSPSEPPR
jgi:hypothetical protein